MDKVQKHNSFNIKKDTFKNLVIGLGNVEI
jgi:hypothetical protein